MFLCYELFAECPCDWQMIGLTSVMLTPTLKSGALVLALQMRKLRHKDVKCLAQHRGEAQVSAFTAHAIHRACISNRGSVRLP